MSFCPLQYEIPLKLCALSVWSPMREKGMKIKIMNILPCFLLFLDTESKCILLIFWLVSYALGGSWIHNLTLYALTREGGDIWATIQRRVNTYFNMYWQLLISLLLSIISFPFFRLSEDRQRAKAGVTRTHWSVCPLNPSRWVAPLLPLVGWAGSNPFATARLANRMKQAQRPLAFTIPSETTKIWPVGRQEMLLE